MGVYIRGMEMPTSCRACLYSRTDIRNVDWCVLTEKDLPCECPIIPVPPHGRLIDADVLMRHCVMLPRDGGSLPVVYASYLRNAPTIIPAEETLKEATT